MERYFDVVDKILWLLNGEAKLFKGAEVEAESLKLDLRILRATIVVSYKPRPAIEKSGFKELKELWESVKFVMDTFLRNLEQLPPQQQQEWQRQREQQERQRQQQERQRQRLQQGRQRLLHQQWQVLQLLLMQQELQQEQREWQQEWTQSNPVPVFQERRRLQQERRRLQQELQRLQQDEQRLQQEQGQVLHQELQRQRQWQQEWTQSSPVSVFPGKNAVKDIHEKFAKLETEHSQGSRRSTSLLENIPRVFLEEELVGIKSRKEDLVRMLVGESSTATRSVISLVGIAGVGKTTLASVVYQSKDVQQHFDCRAWINVPQFYSFDNLFSCLANAICPDEDCLDGEMDRLNRYLMKKRYVIVFDDVWQTDFFQVMNDILPNNNEGCRIIITTRDNLIATSCDVVQTLHPLSEQMALELFWKSANRSRYGYDVYADEELSLKTVQRCHGLPLLIWAMRDLFTTKRSLLPIKEVESQWRVLLDNFEAEFGGSPSQVEEVCRVFHRNYGELPSRSRLCLMYFGIFPQDYLIPDVKLVKLWIAEGFVKEEMGKTLEQVAETYLHDLINRNLVQVSCINYDGTERMCRVHGFIHHIISSNAERGRIFEALRETRTTIETRATIFPNVVTRCFYGDTISSLEMTSKQPNVSTVFLSDVNQIMMRKSVDKRFKLLELLDFENAPLDDLPKEIGKLSFLKYLSLRNTKVKKLPQSVGQLINLQTLDVRNTLMQELPIEIQKLCKLRHLMASARNNQGNLDSVHGVQIKGEIGCLENLQTLMTVEAKRSALVVIEELEKLRQLRCLSISKLTAEMVSTLCSFIEKMNLLESLNLYLSTDRETFDLESISSPPPLLRRLVLKGWLEKLPDWILGLQNLSMLSLSFSKLAVDPLKALQCLPNLKFLWLHRAYEGEQLHFEGVSFQKLKQLVLTELHYLRTVRIEKGALPMLEVLRVGPCHNDLSFDIQNLTNLQLLEFYDMSDEFVLRLQPEGGSDYRKIKHVPSVVFLYRISGSRYVSFKLGEPDLLDRLIRLVRKTSNGELYERQLSFFYNDDEEAARTSNAEWSDQYSNFTDDVEY